MKLTIVGPIEKDDSISEDEFKYLQNDQDIIMTGHVNDTVRYYNIMDVLLFLHIVKDLEM